MKLISAESIALDSTSNFAPATLCLKRLCPKLILGGGLEFVVKVIFFGSRPAAYPTPVTINIKASSCTLASAVLPSRLCYLFAKK